MRCDQCEYWEPAQDSYDDRGFRRCLAIASDPIGPTKDLALVEEAPCQNLLLKTRGAFGCVLFSAKAEFSGAF